MKDLFNKMVQREKKVTTNRNPNDILTIYLITLKPRCLFYCSLKFRYFLISSYENYALIINYIYAHSYPSNLIYNSGKYMSILSREILQNYISKRHK